MAKRFIIAGGGTGGHIFPAIAIANALKATDSSVEILFVGAKGKMEMEKVPQAGYRIVGLDIAGFNRSSILKNITLPFKLARSFYQVRNIFSEFKPDAVIGVGGYSSFPVLRYAQSKKIPSFIHESNSFAGKSNMLLGKKATKIFTATAGMEKFFPAEKIMVTGNPVRTGIEGRGHRKEALEFFGLSSAKQTLLVVGGSLGAKSINQAIADHLTEITDSGLQVIWQTGRNEEGKWKQAAHGNQHVWINDFIVKMELGYAAADMVISRAGAMAMAELCLVGKPVVFVPYPFAAEDHQTANARYLVDRHAALMVKDDKAKNQLVPQVMKLASDSTLRDTLEKEIIKYAVFDADHVIASTILESLKD